MLQVLIALPFFSLIYAQTQICLHHYHFYRHRCCYRYNQFPCARRSLHFLVRPLRRPGLEELGHCVQHCQREDHQSGQGLVEAGRKRAASPFFLQGTILRGATIMSSQAWIFQRGEQVRNMGEDKAPWYVGWYDLDGHRHKESCGSGFQGKKKAERLRNKIDNDLMTGVHQKNSRKLWPDFRREYASGYWPARPSRRGCKPPSPSTISSASSSRSACSRSARATLTTSLRLGERNAAARGVSLSRRPASTKTCATSRRR